MRALRTLVVTAVGMFAAVTASAPAHADGGGDVVAGTFTMTITVADPVDQSLFAKPGTRTWYFGSGCTAGKACSIGRTVKEGPDEQQALTASGAGFTFTSHQDLDCHDDQTGALSTKHGADYDLVATVTPSAFTTRDGVRYATALRATYDEKIVVNAAGRADNCDDGAGHLELHQKAVLTGTLVPLAAPPASDSDKGLGVDPATAGVTGNLPRFLLPRTTRETKSGAAVSAGRLSSVPGALVVPSDAARGLGSRLVKDLGLAALLGLLMVFPAMLFNATYEENHERIDRQLGRLRRRRTASAEATRVPSRGRRLGVFLGCALVGTLLGGFLDPKLSASTASVALLVGVFGSVLVAVLVAAVAGRWFRSATHTPHEWYLRAIPSALLVAVVCVLVSRLVHFAPGYLYGVLGGAVFVAAMERRAEGRAEAAVLVGGLVLALGAWVAFQPVSAAASGTGASFGVLAADSFLAALFVGGIEGLLFALVPLRFLPGYRITRWSWVAWGLLAAVVLLLFVHVLLLPASGYLGRSTSASVSVTIALFVVFAAASVSFWAWFRWRPDPRSGAGPIPAQRSGEASDAMASSPVLADEGAS